MGEKTLPVQDVLIVGGGIAGLGTAIALGRRGVRTTVVEHGDGAVGASIAIGERAVYALEELGILDSVIDRGQPAWKDDPLQYGVYEPNGRRLPTAAPDHGEDWELPTAVAIFRPYLAEVMRAAATENGAEVLMGHSYRSIEVLGDHVEAELTTGEHRRFDLLVAADGVHSELRSRFFPDAGDPVYTGSMSFRVMIENAPPDWRTGRYVANGNGLQTVMLPNGLFYLALPQHMEFRHLDQAEARRIVRRALEDYRPSEMFDELAARLTDDVEVIVGAFEWIFVEPPWHQGRVVLVGDAVHATAPTIGMAGGMAVEDAVVLAQELAKTDDVEQALRAYAARRCERAKLVVETSATLMQTHQEHRPPVEEAAMRTAARQQLVTAY